MSAGEPRPIFIVKLQSTVYDSGMWLSSRSCTVETPSVVDAFDFFDSYRAAADDIVGTRGGEGGEEMRVRRDRRSVRARPRFVPLRVIR